MKKAILILFAIAAIFNVKAQDERFTVGLKGGYTLTRFDLSNYDQRVLQLDDRDSKSGYLVGLYTRVKIFKGLSFQPEFYYAKKQGKFTVLMKRKPELEIPDTSFITQTTVKSWELPMLIHLKLIEFDAGNIYAVTGPVLSFVKEGYTDVEDGFKFNNSNWTYMLGGGVEIWRISVDARYEWALSNTATYTKVVDIGRFTADEFYHMLTVSVGFKLFGK